MSFKKKSSKFGHQSTFLHLSHGGLDIHSRKSHIHC